MSSENPLFHRRTSLFDTEAHARETLKLEDANNDGRCALLCRSYVL